jgi:hypothetical protein
MRRKIDRGIWEKEKSRKRKKRGKDGRKERREKKIGNRKRKKRQELEYLGCVHHQRLSKIPFLQVFNDCSHSCFFHNELLLVSLPYHTKWRQFRHKNKLRR